MGRAAKQGVEQLSAELDEALRQIAALESEREALRTSSGLAQHLFDGFALIDLQGVHLDVNTALCTMTGFSRDELVGAGEPHPYWPPEAYDTIREEFAKDLAGDIRPAALTFMRKNGERFPVLVAPAVIRDQAGAVTAMVSTIKDMSELTAARTELADSKARLAVIASNTPDHILMQDNQLRYTFVINPQLGLTEQDMIGKTDYDFLSKEEADRLTQIKTRVMDSGRPARFETSLVSKTGQDEYFDGTFVPRFDARGKADGLIGYFTNVSAKERAEAALRESDAQLRLALQAAPITMFSQDHELKYTWIHNLQVAMRPEDIFGKVRR
ncbi:MAG TPA: PAS domain S-box protein [Thermoleophilia bacterium]|nr:PAS domain S-box protein [Thermoleophilia bacterium]